MTEKLFNEGIIRLKTGTVAVLAISTIGCLLGAGVGWEKVQARLRHLDGKTDLYAQRFDALENRVDQNDKTFIEIKKDLQSIETHLLDLKQRIK